jgi:SAM-dependent methyltransferase
MAQDGNRFWEQAESIVFSERRRAAASTEIERAVALLGIEPPARVLDLACGVGRHTLELARRDFRVTGVDKTAAYLRQAADAADAAGLAVELVEADMRAFRRPDAVDAAICLYTSFGYFRDPRDDSRVLAGLYESLRPSGRLLLEMVGKELVGRSRQRRWQEVDGRLLLHEWKVSENWGWIDEHVIAVTDDGRTDVTFSFRLYSAAELTARLEECGFGQVSVHGDFDGSPYDWEARSLVVVARRDG